MVPGLGANEFGGAIRHEGRDCILSFECSHMLLEALEMLLWSKWDFILSVQGTGKMQRANMMEIH